MTAWCNPYVLARLANHAMLADQHMRAVAQAADLVRQIEQGAEKAGELDAIYARIDSIKQARRALLEGTARAAVRLAASA